MAEETMTATHEPKTKAAALAEPEAPAEQSTSKIPAFALNAANAQVRKLGDILGGAADSIDDLIGKNSSLLPEAVQGFASTASSRLRELADSASEEQAEQLLKNLQKGAAEHPIATAGIGAAIGTALGVALSRISKPASTA